MDIKKGVLVALICLSLISFVQAIKIEIDTLEETFSVGESITLKVTLLNEENNPINDDVSIILEDAEKMNKIKNTVFSNRFVNIELGEKALGGYWTITAEYNDYKATKVFNIESKELVRFDLKDDVLTIKNIGNVEYSKTIKIIIEDNIELKPTKLGVGEETKYRLVAPEGNYEIIITDDVTTLRRGDVRLTGTGKVIGSIEDRNTQRSSITGGISPDEEDDLALFNYMKKSSLIYLFIFVVFGVAILIAVQSRFIKKKNNP